MFKRKQPEAIDERVEETRKLYAERQERLFQLQEEILSESKVALNKAYETNNPEMVEAIAGLFGSVFTDAQRNFFKRR